MSARVRVSTCMVGGVAVERIDRDDSPPEYTARVPGDGVFLPMPSLSAEEAAHDAVGRLIRRGEKTPAKQLDALVTAVRRERAARVFAAWLASLPDGSCCNPPPQELIDAEAATGEVLATMEGTTP